MFRTNEDQSLLMVRAGSQFCSRTEVTYCHVMSCHVTSHQVTASYGTVTQTPPLSSPLTEPADVIG